VLDVSDKLDLEARLAAASHAHLGFQRLVTDVAIRFATIDSEAVDDTIADGLQQIGEALHLDTAALWRWRVGDTTGGGFRRRALLQRPDPDRVDPARRGPTRGRQAVVLFNAERSARSRSRGVP
jgi:hypothetical protein